MGFFSQWHGLVGTDLAAHADPVDIKNGALYLEVDHPAWLQRLHAKQAEILEAIQDRFPNLGIEQLCFRMAREETGSPDPLPKNVPPAGNPFADQTPAPETGPDSAPRRAAAAAPPSENASEALERLPESNLKRSLERLKDHLEHRD
ncbi:MAG: DUF721 domain-containing protein [Spirochaetota bacterium]